MDGFEYGLCRRITNTHRTLPPPNVYEYPLRGRCTTASHPAQTKRSRNFPLPAEVKGSLLSISSRKQRANY